MFVFYMNILKILLAHNINTDNVNEYNNTQ